MCYLLFKMLNNVVFVSAACVRKGSVLYASRSNVIKFLSPHDISLRQQQAAGWGSWLSQNLGLSTLSGGQMTGLVELGDKDECIARLRQSEKILGVRVSELEAKMETFRASAATYLVSCVRWSFF